MAETAQPLADLAMERAVLDAILAAPATIPAVRAVLDPRAFYWNQHRSIYRVTLALADAGQEPDALTVGAELNRQGPPKHGQTWVATILDVMGAAAVWGNAARYAARVAELGHLRRMAHVSTLLAATPEDAELRDELRAVMDAADAARSGARRLVAPSVELFLAQEEEVPPCLVGTVDDMLLPAGGLLIEFAKGGRGKTTLTVDMAVHMASGIDWLGFRMGRPLRVLFVENEGPRYAFRAKLARKLDAWPHPITGGLFVVSEPWGQVSLADRVMSSELRELIVGEAIDVVIGDPLDSLGLNGVGSPEDTRAFLGLLGQLGLTRDVAFVLLHHPRKELTSDELDEIGGAWGGRPDTMLRLAKLDGNRARLSFPKVRWSRFGEHQPLILDFDPETDGFSVLAVETPPVEPEERDVLAELREILADGVWRSVRELMAPKSKGGIGARHAVILAALEEHRGDLFAEAEGKYVGRPHAPSVWRLMTGVTDARNAGNASGGLGEGDGGVTGGRDALSEESVPRVTLPAPPGVTRPVTQ